ncbi:DNA replication terminus site-binding protein [Photobacterium leiognathi]|uniref:DNA replication terminus site-binding protein n=1 Tax=Photobacterium leiognathi TaxID=553611 RepID=UPI0029822529|nr:DNA replication terminus site-binding protein [Photobacterium leiognathi]
MSISEQDPNEIYDQLKSKIADLITHLKKGKYIHASAQLFPLAAIDENGADSVFSETEQIKLERFERIEALEHYFDILKPQTKKLGVSSVSARRLSGIIHLSGDQQWLDKSYTLLSDIHVLKKDFKDRLVELTSTRYARQQLLKTFAPELLPLTAYRQFPFIHHSTPIEKVYFSWVTQGRTYEELEVEEVEHRINLRNERKIKLGCELPLSQLNEIDIKALGNIKKFTLVRPSKVYATLQTSDLNNKISMPMKLSVPLLIFQKTPLQQYSELSDFIYQPDKVKKLNKRSNLIPVIEEYGLFVKP